MKTFRLTKQRKRTLVEFFRCEVEGLPAPTVAEISALHGWLSERAGLRHLNTLMRNGLLVRVDTSDDSWERRQQIRRLTPEGRRIARTLYQRASQMAREISRRNYARILAAGIGREVR